MHEHCAVIITIIFLPPSPLFNRQHSAISDWRIRENITGTVVTVTYAHS